MVSLLDRILVNAEGIESQVFRRLLRLVIAQKIPQVLPNLDELAVRTYGLRSLRGAPTIRKGSEMRRVLEREYVESIRHRLHPELRWVVA